MKNCDSCYWKDYKNIFCIYKEVRPKDSICDEYDYKCKCGGIAVVKYDGVPHCQDCFFESLEIWEYITTHYVWDGEYLDPDEDMDEVMRIILDGFGEEVEQLS